MWSVLVGHSSHSGGVDDAAKLSRHGAVIQAFLTKDSGCLTDQLILFRTGENAGSANHYRDVFGGSSGLQALQDLEAAHAGHVEIENNELGFLVASFLKSVVSVISLADKE